MNNDDFIPYIPPNHGNGPLTIDKDITQRVNDGIDIVTPAVIEVVAWMLIHGRLGGADEAQLLNGLGLELRPNRHGTFDVRPKQEFIDIGKKEQEQLLALHESMKAKIMEGIGSLTPDDRLEVFCRYCPHCGDTQPEDPKAMRCQCWNDE